MFFVVPIFHVHTVCHCKRLPIQVFDHLFPRCNEFTLCVIIKLHNAKKCCLFMYDSQADVIQHVLGFEHHASLLWIGATL